MAQTVAVRPHLAPSELDKAKKNSPRIQTKIYKKNESTPWQLGNKEEKMDLDSYFWRVLAMGSS
jgi:hypothetical protein